MVTSATPAMSPISAPQSVNSYNMSQSPMLLVRVNVNTQGDIPMGDVKFH